MEFLIIKTLIFVFLVLLFLKYFIINKPATPLKCEMTGKIIIVTGCSAGIGKETAIELLKRGATVIWACRDEKKTLNVIKQATKSDMKGNSIFINLDLSSFKSVYLFYLNFKQMFDRLDV